MFFKVGDKVRLTYNTEVEYEVQAITRVPDAETRDGRQVVKIAPGAWVNPRFLELVPE